ncbi:cupin domain-containing protein [Paraburkholderia sp. HP33-1]|uniref:cupin domain-containing protein n=1 Tax=Paraburkholderia sp. HP33-1 TaxID=2883243 RepID=UPI001F283A98|nr:cupin domain-containing protein [Paraburkholderia sp. HP33-1]
MNGSPSQERTDYTGLTHALAQVNAQPLWDRFRSLVTREPTPPDEPHIWPWKSMLPLIERTAREVSMDDAERRVLLLTNPAFDGMVKTTTNLNAALQILEPGEHAHEHRHRIAAIRLVLEGNSATTVVDGKHCEMRRGDLVLTPSLCWHGHYNNGDERVVWLDGLDLPLALHNLGVVSFQPGPANVDVQAPPADDAFTQGGILPQGLSHESPHSPMFRYSWEATKRTFESTPAASDGSKLLRYTNPRDGGAVMPTLDCYALELAAAQETVARRTTSNAIVAVLDGEGETRIGSKVIRWRRNDVFTVPHWNWVSHRAEHEGAHLFMMTDREVLARLGYLVEEIRGGEA